MDLMAVLSEIRDAGNQIQPCGSVSSLRVHRAGYVPRARSQLARRHEPAVCNTGQRELCTTGVYHPTVYIRVFDGPSARKIYKANLQQRGPSLDQVFYPLCM
jgi:hypothetical protein